jgi:hypothetical protein
MTPFYGTMLENSILEAGKTNKAGKVKNLEKEYK